MSNTYFKYCEANNRNTLSSYSDGKQRIGYECKRFESPEEADKAGYVRLLHDVKPVKVEKEPVKKPRKKRGPNKKKAVTKDDNSNSKVCAGESTEGSGSGDEV